MNTELATKNQESKIAVYHEEPVTLLTTRTETGVATYDADRFRTWAATISAGYKKDNVPQVVRDAKIFLHEDCGDAPGLRSALEASGKTNLTITMVSNNVQDCLKQLFVAYGETKIFGNQEKLTVLYKDKGKPFRKVVLAGTPEYADYLSQCKVSTFVPFYLAEWQGKESRIIFPDGFMPYRLRFGSENSANAFVDALQALKRLTGGALLGVPLNLSIVYPHVMCPDHVRRQVPIWRVVLKYPGGLTMGAGELRGVLESGLRDASQMALPAAIALEENLEAIVLNDEALDVDETTGERRGSASDVRTVTEGSTPDRRRDDYFKAMQGTPFASDEYRPDLVQKMADNAGVQLSAPSLKELCEVATADEWIICTEVMCKAAAEYHGTENTKEPKAVVAETDPYATPEVKTAVAPVTPAAPVAPATPAAPAPAEEQLPSIPEIRDYFVLDRAPTGEECTVATAYLRKHLNQVEFSRFGKACGGIHPIFGILQARNHNLTNFRDMMLLLDPDWKDEAEPTPSYLTLDRAPTAEESAAAVEFATILKPAQFDSLVLAAGGIHIHFVLLEAQRLGLTDFPGIMRLVDADYQEAA